MNCRMCSDALDMWPSWFTLGAKPGKGCSKKTVESKRNVTSFVRRTDAEIDEIVQKWERYAHPRARDFFTTKEELFSILRQLAMGIQKDEDPILTEDGPCVYWYGDVTREEQQAAIRMMKPGESQESVTFVNRVLAFIFGTDESFELLMKLPKEPFRMICGDQLCVNIGHISLEVDDK